MPDDADDLEPIPTAERPPPTAIVDGDGDGEDADETSGVHIPGLRQTFLVVLAVVVAVAIVVFAVQLRAIARDTQHSSECNEALVALVSSSSDARAVPQDVRDRLDACLGTSSG